MHDLVHDLARSVVGNNECLIVENALDIDYISEATRRLNLLVDLDDEEMLPKVIEAMKKAKNLRTILVNKQIIRFDIGNAFKENKRLRVLDMSGSDVRTQSTCSIGGLKHLRYLDVEKALFPKGIGRLSFLQTLKHFDVGDKKKNKNASVIEELEGLNLLTGDLSIGNLENVTSETAACRANLKEKKKLRRLDLTWTTWYGRYDHHHAKTMLELLQPHPNLTTLEINSFKGSKFPGWIEDSSCLPNLVHLVLLCGMFEKLAGFGALPSLRSLNLYYVRELKCIGNEFYYSTANGETSTAAAFPLLKNFTLGRMPSLKERVIPVPPLASTTTGTTTTTTCCFPLLEEITIDRCSLLTTITPTTTIFPCLKILDLSYIDGRAAKPLVMANLSSLTSLRLRDIPNLITLPRQGLLENNSTLLSLEIRYCPHFKGFLLPNKDEDEDENDDQGGGGGQQLQISQVVSSSCSSSLQSLTLYECPVLRLFPNISSLTSLRKLEIQYCKEPRSLLDELTCLPSLLEYLEHVKILKSSTEAAEEEVVFDWRK